MKTNLHSFLILAALVANSTQAVAENFKSWNESEIVFVGKLDRVDEGAVGRSFPPVYTHRLHFTVERVLRGNLKPGEAIVASHVARQHQRPVFPTGELCLTAASEARGSLRIAAVEQANNEKIEKVELLCALPLGWEVVD